MTAREYFSSREKDKSNDTEFFGLVENTELLYLGG